MSELWQERGRDPLCGYRILRIGLNTDRDQLYAQINARAAAMFAQGLVEENRLLLEKYPQLSCATPFSSLGYKQARAYIDGELTLAEAVALTQQGHRNYAKRQMTWFRREPEVSWLAGFGDDHEIEARAAEFLHAAISGDSS